MATVAPQEIYDYLRNKGLSHYHAIGMVNNIKYESGFDPGVRGDYMISDPSGKMKNYERLVYWSPGSAKWVYASPRNHKNGQAIEPEFEGSVVSTSGGLFQHQGSRFTALAASNKNWDSDWKSQIDFALEEADTKRYLKEDVKSEAEASEWFTVNWERPDDRHNEAKKRSKGLSSLGVKNIDVGEVSVVSDKNTNDLPDFNTVAEWNALDKDVKDAWIKRASGGDDRAGDKLISVGEWNLSMRKKTSEGNKWGHHNSVLVLREDSNGNNFSKPLVYIYSYDEERDVFGWKLNGDSVEAQKDWMSIDEGADLMKMDGNDGRKVATAESPIDFGLNFDSSEKERIRGKKASKINNPIDLTPDLEERVVTTKEDEEAVEDSRVIVDIPDDAARIGDKVIWTSDEGREHTLDVSTGKMQTLEMDGTTTFDENVDFESGSQDVESVINAEERSGESTAPTISQEGEDEVNTVMPGLEDEVEEERSGESTGLTDGGSLTIPDNADYFEETNHYVWTDDDGVEHKYNANTKTLESYNPESGYTNNVYDLNVDESTAPTISQEGEEGSSQKSSFDEARKASEEQGLAEFTFDGKKYNTKSGVEVRKPFKPREATLFDKIGGVSTLVAALFGAKGVHEAMKDIDIPNTPGLSDAFKRYFYESEQLAKSGLGLAEQQEVQRGINEAHAQGLDNLVRGTSGDRAKFLAGLGVLDHQRQTSLLKAAAMNDEVKRENRKNYSTLLNFKEEFENKKAVSERNEELVMALKKQEMFAEMGTNAFKQIMDNINSAQMYGRGSSFDNAIQQRMYNLGMEQSEDRGLPPIIKDAWGSVKDWFSGDNENQQDE